MHPMIFVNLPVKDLEKSKAFYEAVGLTNNPQFTDETAACMVLSETIFVMLLTHAKFSEFTDRQIADAHKVHQVLNALTRENRDEVNATLDKAVAAGGRESRPPMDMGFMFQRSFADLDGHVWEMIWMDPAAVQG
jgi:predicted lactoylglutathione lyase